LNGGGGQEYIRDDNVKYGNRFGIQTYPSVTLVFNKKEAQRKIYNNLSYQSNEKWIAPINGDIFTSELNEYTNLPQISALIEKDGTRRGNYVDFALLRDANSMADAREALIEGDFLNGQYMVCKLTYFGDKFVHLFSPYVSDENQPRNF